MFIFKYLSFIIIFILFNYYVFNIFEALLLNMPNIIFYHALYFYMYQFHLFCWFYFFIYMFLFGIFFGIFLMFIIVSEYMYAYVVLVIIYIYQLFEFFMFFVYLYVAQMLSLYILLIPAILYIISGIAIYYFYKNFAEGTRPSRFWRNQGFYALLFILMLLSWFF